MRIILASGEVSPFAKTGGLGDVAEILPQSLNKLGHECSVIMPLYRLVRKNGYSPKIVKSAIPVKIGGKDHAFDLSLINFKGTNFYFVGNDDLYDRENLYGTPQGDYDDNLARYVLFSRAVLESAKYIGKPDIIHCNDWHTGLVPFYLKTLYKDDPNLEGAKVLYSIHNIAYQGLFPKEMLPAADIPKSHFTSKGLEFYDKISFMKSGIVYSDAISTV
ncbi:MAG: glycogen/starch synthase, partial [Candidatus Omnitrophota bacterium]